MKLSTQPLPLPPSLERGVCVLFDFSPIPIPSPGGGRVHAKELSPPPPGEGRGVGEKFQQRNYCR